MFHFYTETSFYGFQCALRWVNISYFLLALFALAGAGEILENVEFITLISLIDWVHSLFLLNLKSALHCNVHTAKCTVCICYYILIINFSISVKTNCEQKTCSQLLHWRPSVSFPAYLLFFRHKHLLGLFDHRLWLELIFTELVFAWVKQFAPWNTRQDQVSGIWVVVDIDLNFVRVLGVGRLSVLISGHFWAEKQGNSIQLQIKVKVNSTITFSAMKSKARVTCSKATSSILKYMWDGWMFWH